MSDHEVVEQQTETAPPPEAEPDTTDPRSYEEAPTEGPSALEGEAEAPAEAEAEAKPEPPRQIEQDGQKYVTLDALREERRKNREEAERHERRLREMEERFTRAQQPEAEPEPDFDIPDPNEDIIGATAAIREQIIQQREQEAYRRQQEQAEQQQTQLQETVRRSALTQVEEFKKDHPEYDQAYHHLKSAREQFYTAMGYSPMDVQQVLAQEEFNIAYQLVANNRSVPEAVVAMAQQAGWRPEQEQKAEDKIQRVAEGQKQAKTLAGGGAPDAEKDIRWLASLSDEEFAKVDDATFRRIMS